MRAALLVVYIAELVAGAFIAALAIGSAFDNAGTDSFELFVGRTAVAAALVTVLIAFAALLATRGFTPAAPVLFAISYIAAGFVAASTRGVAKGFPSAAVSELPELYATFAAIIVVAIAISAAAWWWTRRLSRLPLMQ